MLARSPVKLRTCRGIRQRALKGSIQLGQSPRALFCRPRAEDSSVLGVVVVVVVVVVVLPEALASKGISLRVRLCIATAVASLLHLRIKQQKEPKFRGGQIPFPTHTRRH